MARGCLFQTMRFTIAYIAITSGIKTTYFAQRFASTLKAHPPGAPFELYVICNGGPPPATYGEIFKEWDTKFFPRENVGGDIGGYIDLAKLIAPGSRDDHCMVCLGESVFFWRENWLARIGAAWCQCGPGMYGFYASNLVTKHLNTTAFAVDPRLLLTWPEPMRTQEHRYSFEHGAFPFWRRVEAQGRPVRLVNWDSTVPPEKWRTTPNEFWRGDQSQCLMWCSHTERWTQAPKGTKTRWTHNADVGLR